MVLIITYGPLVFYQFYYIKGMIRCLLAMLLV